MWSELINELKIVFKTLKILYKAMVLQNKKEYQKTIEYLEEGITFAKKGSEYSNYPLGILYYQIGYTYNIIEEFEKAYDYLRKAHSFFLKATGQYTVDLAENYIELGLSRSGLYDYESAIVYYERAIHIYLELDFKNKLPLAWLYSNLGLTFKRVGKFDKSNEYFEKSILIYEKYKNRKGLVLKLRADISMNNGDYLSALEYRKELLDFRLKKFNPNSFEIAQCYSYIAEVYIKMGDEKNSLENFARVSKYRKENNITDYSMTYIYTGLSRSFKLKKDFPKAIEHLEKSLSYAEANKDYSNEELIEFHTELGYLHLKNSDSENAIRSYEKALSLSESLAKKNRSTSFEIFYELGFLYENKKNRTKANRFFKNLIELYDKDLWQDIPHIANTYRIYGEVWLSRKNAKKAIEYLEKAQSLHLKTVTQNEIRAIATTASNYLNLSKAFILQKKSEIALKYLLLGLTSFLNYTTDEESDFNKNWDEFEENYRQKNKEFKSLREINYYLYYYKQLKINFVDSFFENLKNIRLKKAEYKKVILFFEKLSKEKPRHYNWCKERIKKIKELYA